jgi:endoglucanase
VPIREPMTNHTPRSFLAAIVTVVFIALMGSGIAPVSAAPGTLVRVNQVGYVSGSGSKVVFVLSSAPCAGLAFTVEDTSHTVVDSGTVGADRGGWNSTFHHVCGVDLGSGVTGAGTYTVHVGSVISPSFQVAPAQTLYGGLIANALQYYVANRDGADVDGSVLERKPSHLNDRHAPVYRIPTYAGERLVSMKKVGGTHDVSGGWFDAGDYVKFVGTTSFTVATMLTAIRDHPTLFTGGGPAFKAEAKRGIAWLLKTWDDHRRVLYYQVGIGSGNATIQADHDVWRLPQKDDHYTGHARRFLAHRPALRVGPPGAKLPPSLAGRLAGVFGLCAQLWDGTPLATKCLRSGEHVFALAKTKHVGVQVLASPVSYYRESRWHDDLELGSAELFWALHDASSVPSSLPHTAPRYYLKASAKWARAYIDAKHNGEDTFNLYDSVGLAHPDLYRAIGAGGGAGLPVSQGAILADLRAQLDPHAADAAADPFGFGASLWDPVPHAFGLVSEGLRYDQLSGTSRYAAMARAQVDWALGANAWGSSFVVGAGTTFPFCMQHEVANLVGSTDGSNPLLLGATVDGPSDYVPGPGFFGNATPCPPGGGDVFKSFDKASWRYVDRVSSWATVEPTLDYTALSFYAFVMLSGA